MQRYPEAEKMHLKAIQIKESLLGTEDYEVALSVGQLRHGAVAQSGGALPPVHQDWQEALRPLLLRLGV